MWWVCLLVLTCLQLHITLPLADARPLTDWQQPLRLPQSHHYVYQKRSASSKLNTNDDDENENSVENSFDSFGFQRLLDTPVDESASQPNSIYNPTFLDQPHQSGANPSGLGLFKGSPTASKRAFTLLSRWHPFSTLSRNVPSIREQNRQIFNDLDIETRAMLRPVGQPLRWG